MHPAFSIIFFTSMSGAGFGAMAVAALLTRYIGNTGTTVTLVLGFILAGVGLLGSVAHLKSPMRARFALSQWRTSWLSREGVLSILTMGLAALIILRLFTVGHGDGSFDLWRALGVVMVLLAAGTIASTGMIYQSIAAVPDWSRQPTSLMFLLFAATSGGLIGLASAGQAGNMAYGVALFFLFTLWYFKITVWSRTDKAEPIATVGSATGLGPAVGGEVRQFERPHVTENWLTTEMGFRVGRRHAMKLRIGAVALGGLLPAGLIALALAGIAPHGVCWLAVALHMAGVFMERWLFFAQAKHTVSLFYGAQSV